MQRFPRFCKGGGEGVERIKVNFNLGSLKIEQGEVDSYDGIIKQMNNGEPFITIYNRFGDPIAYNKNNIVWICEQRED